jgi:AraC-like DNA-binding protein
LLGLVAHLAAHHGSTRGQLQRRPATAPIARARALVDDDPAAPLRLDDLAAAAGLGRFQLLRGFARELGLTPHAYLLQRRLALARRLIAEGSGLAGAAVAAGFADQSHLNRVFVRHLAITPGQYAAAVAAA